MEISPIIRNLSTKYCLERNPQGHLGAYTRNGGDDFFFTPVEELIRREQAEAAQAQTAPKQETRTVGVTESPEEYYQRKLFSHEWMG